MGVSHSDRAWLSTAFEKSIRKLAMPALPYGMAGYTDRERFLLQNLRVALAPINTINNLGRYGARLFADAAPGALDVLQFGGGLADAEAESELAIEFRVRQIQIAALIETIHDGLVDGVATAMAKADKIQGRGCGEFELFVFADPRCKLLREFDVTSNMILQTFDAVVANHEP